jgi:hypothetical protein
MQAGSHKKLTEICPLETKLFLKIQEVVSGLLKGV